MIIGQEVITSRANGRIKGVAALLDKKGRAEQRRFIAEGVKLTLEALDGGLPVEEIYVALSKKEQILDALSHRQGSQEHSGVSVTIVDDSVFEKISTEKAPQGVITVIKYLDFFFNKYIIYKEEFFLGTEERALMLYSVRDPSNLGSVIRSAVAFGIEHILLSSDCADLYNPKTIRSAMGSLFKVKATVLSDVPSFIEAAKACGRRLFAAELRENSVPLNTVDIGRTDIVVIGNEGHGIDEEISKMCTSSVYIPISANTESLNASVAAAVFMWEQSKR